MSTQDILNLYNIKMYNKVDTVSLTGSKVNNKVFLGGNQMEIFFELSYNDPDVINEDVLTKVNYILNGNTPPLNSIDCQLGGISTSPILYSDAVRFHNPNTGAIVQTVPLNDFKVIAEAWRDFLLQPPLIGANVS